jgi:hypothetical protein
LCSTNFKTFDHLNVQLWMLSFEPKPPLIISRYSFSKNIGSICVSSTTLISSYINVMLRPTFCMAKPIPQLLGLLLLLARSHVLVLPFGWFESDVKGMFHSLLAFLREVIPFSTTSMTSFNCWYVHFEHTKIKAYLLIRCVHVLLVHVWSNWVGCFFYLLELHLAWPHDDVFKAFGHSSWLPSWDPIFNKSEVCV